MVQKLAYRVYLTQRFLLRIIRNRRLFGCNCVFDIAEATLWVGFLYMTSASKTDKDVAKDENLLS